MILRYRNAKTGQVQSVLDGSRLHRLVEANPAGYEPVKEQPKRRPSRKKKVTSNDAIGDESGRGDAPGSNSDDGGGNED